MGISPVDFQEIKAFCDLCQLELTTWEASLLQRLSVEYCVQYSKSDKPDCKPPYDSGAEYVRELTKEKEADLRIFFNRQIRLDEKKAEQEKIKQQKQTNKVRRKV